jgi:hypothetical protein
VPVSSKLPFSVSYDDGTRRQVLKVITDTLPHFPSGPQSKIGNRKSKIN